MDWGLPPTSRYAIKLPAKGIGIGDQAQLSRTPTSYRTAPLAEGDRLWPRDSANDDSANDG